LYVFETKFLVFQSSYQLLINYVLFSIFEIDLRVDIVWVLLIQLGLKLLFNYLTDGHCNPENVELSIVKYLIP